MKKGMVIFIVLIILLLAAISNSGNCFVIVDKEIQSDLEKNKEVPVIVVLKDNYRLLNKKAVKSFEKRDKFQLKKEMIKRQQENVLSTLNLKNRKTKSLLGAEEFDFELRHKYSTVNSFSGKLTKSGLNKLKNSPYVKEVYLSKTKKIFLDTSAVQINATKVWSLVYNNTNITGTGETVCILDTGVDYTHSDLGDGWGNKVIGGYRSLNNGADTQECDVNNSACMDDHDHGHGTHVAGIVASNHSTYRGIAPDAKIIAVKICDSGGSCEDADINAGIDWCVNNASKFNISVISMSLGDCSNHSTYCNDDSSASHINTAVGHGITVTIAAGNGPTGSCASSGITNTDGPSAPACVENATAIGAVNDGDAITYQRGALFEILAPGVSITSLNKGGGTRTESGTSMATPHAAGAAALLQQFYRLHNGPKLTT